MASLAQRYLEGDYETVWNEIRRMGPVGVADRSDVNAVADETMRRVHRHVRRITEGMVTLGFVPASPNTAIHAEPSDDDRRELARLEAEIGALPAALRACMAFVGGVSLVGDCPALGLSYHQDLSLPSVTYPDPLVLPDVNLLRCEWDGYRKSDSISMSVEPQYGARTFWFVFAPDELQKAKVGGSMQLIALPQASADPIIDIGGRRAVMLVEYLRSSVAWGGCPGWVSSPTGPPPALESLRAEPDF